MKKIFLLILLTFSTIFAQGFNMQLLSHFTFEQNASDITGFKQNEREIAVVGLQNAASFVDVTDPAAPFEIGRIEGNNSIWRDMKYWNGFVYIGTEADDGIKVVNVQEIDNPQLVYTITDVDNSHNIHIDEGFLYIVGADEHDIWIYELDSIPGVPQLIGVWDGEYIHDLHVFNDKAYAMGIYTSTVYIIDLFDKSNPFTITSWQYDGFAHDCAVTEDEQILVTADEMSGGHIKIWDISDYSNINQLSEFSVDPNHTVHNVYVVDQKIICSYYADGTRIIDFTNPTNPQEIAYYDTSELDGLYVGNWGVYPFLPSGNIISSDIETGLYVTKFGGISIIHNNLEDISSSIEDVQFSVDLFSPESEVNNVTLHYNLGSAWELLELEWQIENSYSTTLPFFTSGIFVNYYFTAENNAGDFTMYPLNGDVTPISFIYGDFPDIFLDDFENHLGWTTPTENDDATSGLWERGEPVGTYVSDYQVQPENDHTEFGDQCYVTGNQSNPGSAGQNDVDGGKTTLLSPIFDLSQYSEVLCTYWRWYSNNLGNNPSTDHFKIEVSNDNGSSWVSIEDITISQPEWTRHRRLLTDLLPLTSEMQFRFIAEDNFYEGNVGSGGSLVEASIDDFKLEAVGLEILLGDVNIDFDINILDVILVVGFIIEESTPSGYESIASDMNADGIINVLDIIEIVNLIIG